MDFNTNDGTIIRKIQENIEELGQQGESGFLFSFLVFFPMWVSDIFVAL